jgi:hypothetical protein
MSTTTNTIKAANNPNLANSLVEKALAEPQEKDKKVDVKFPTDSTVELPGGYISPAGEVVKTAEVRELTGRDEEAIARTGSIPRALNTILTRGVVKIGTEAATEEVLDLLLGGDRDELLLGIYRVTFGNPAELSGYCGTCDVVKDVSVDLHTDIKRKVLADSINDRNFTVTGRKGVEYDVTLPISKAQREMSDNLEKTGPELATILLTHCVEKINGMPVYDKRQVLDIGASDRDLIAQEISTRLAGPQFADITVDCNDCGEEVVVPINVGRLFRL